MKKILALFVAALMIFGVGTAANAAFFVNVNTNSLDITGATNACELAGNLYFGFDEGTILQDGDTIKVTLPPGVALCQSFDFAVLGASGVQVPGAGGFAGVISAPADGQTLDRDAWAVVDLGGILATDGSITIVGTPMWFRVLGNAGQQSFQILVYDSDDIAPTAVTGPEGAAGVNFDASSTLTVNADTVFQLKLFDSKPHDGTGPSGGIWAFNDTDNGAGGAPDSIYGNAAAALDDYLQADNDWDNSYCITLDSTIFTGAFVIASLQSSSVARGTNFLSFSPSNPQVANLAAAEQIQLELCKGDEYGQVQLTGAQNAVCAFDYDAALGYCTDAQTGGVFTTSGLPGNRLIIQNSSGNFGSVGNDYRIQLRLPGNGAYFGGTPALINGVTGFASSNSTFCSGAPVPTVDVSPAAWTPTTETGASFVAPYASGAGCGAIAANKAVVSIISDTFTGIQNVNRLLVDVPAVVFDPSQFSAGALVAMDIDLWRFPCGLIFSGTRTVAEFVTTCAVAAAGVSNLYYPYAVPLDGSSGFWFGFVLGNPSSAAGTATITYVEMDGDIGTATVTVPALGLVVYGNPELLGMLTEDAGNSGTLGDSAAHIVVNCAFAGAGGFGMTGNGSDSTGYTPYGSATAGVVPWTY